MESKPVARDPEDARAVLAGADLARDRLTSGLRLPTGLLPTLAVAIAVQVATAAWGIAEQTTVGMVVLLAAATWAAFESQWWLVAIAAAAGGVGYAFGVRQWRHVYVDDPAGHARGASPRVLVALALVAGPGLVALLVLA